MNEGEERFELVKKRTNGAFFLNWAVGVKVPLRLDLSRLAIWQFSLSNKKSFSEPAKVSRFC